jgi:hypothetical protein
MLSSFGGRPDPVGTGDPASCGREDVISFRKWVDLLRVVDIDGCDGSGTHNLRLKAELVSHR